MNKGIGPNTNAPFDLLSSDLLLLIGEDSQTSSTLLDTHFGPPSLTHSFRGYLFQKRPRLTTLFSGMGTASVEPLLWELSLTRKISRMLLVGTAGAMPNGHATPGTAYVLTHARAAGSGLDAIGLRDAFAANWPTPANTSTATVVSTDFYYGFSKTVLASRHPLNATALPLLFQSATEDLVDMETAPFYALSHLLFPPGVQYLSIKSPANPAGISHPHLDATPAALEACLKLAATLLS